MKLLDGERGEVYPTERNTLIEKTKNESLRRERYSVWKLLEYALLDTFGIDIRYRYGYLHMRILGSYG